MLWCLIKNKDNFSLSLKSSTSLHITMVQYCGLRENGLEMVLKLCQITARNLYEIHSFIHFILKSYDLRKLLFGPNPGLD
jgi:hypothetical protein